MEQDPADPAARRVPSLDALKAQLAAAPWNDDLTPAFAPVATPRITDRLGRGYYGEDIMARMVTARGEIILDYAAGIEDTNKGGADLVTLAEDERGLVVRFYDNKALTSRRNIASASALDENFDDNLAALKADWGRIAEDPKRTEAEHALFKAALAAVDEPGGVRIDRVLTNANGRVEGMTDRITGTGMILEDLAGNTLPKPPAPDVSAFAPGQDEPPAGAAVPRPRLTPR